MVHRFRFYAALGLVQLKFIREINWKNDIFSDLKMLQL